MYKEHCRSCTGCLKYFKYSTYFSQLKPKTQLQFHWHISYTLGFYESNEYFYGHFVYQKYHISPPRPEVKTDTKK